MSKSLLEFCITENRQELVTQWASDKNCDISPSTVASFSRKKVWWICEKGHAYEMAICDRTFRHRSCPYCSGNRVLVGFNDLGTVNPKLANEWHPTLNEDLTPQMVSAGSNKKVWWLCEKKHEWQAAIDGRNSGANCPFCANKIIIAGENDLETTNPDLARQWHPTKNAPLTPKEVFPGSSRKVWWICEKKHEWQALISSRNDGAGCPVCASKIIIPGENDLASQYPDIAAQWHPTKNGELSPAAVAPCSNRHVWWICEKGHEYPMMIIQRTTRLCSCPYCCGKRVLIGFNDLATLHPDIAEEWHPTLNGSLTPKTVTAGSSRYIWWQCQEGHVWKSKVNYRVSKGKNGCPICYGHPRKNRSNAYKC